jgi:hypothetical protein
MSRLARWIAPAALAGGLVAGLIAIPAAQASPAASIITINATSPNYPHLPAKDHGKVDGHAVVVFKLAPANTATISGTVMTTAANDTATLMAEPFGKTTYTAAGSVPLTTIGANPYSFSVTPSLATHYKVKVTGTDSATSSSVTVYVTPKTAAPQKWVRNKCTTRRCTFSFRLYVTLPKSAFKTESRKHFYLYLAVGELRGRKPVLPKDYTLSKTAKASRAIRVNSGEYRLTLTFFVPIRNARTIWVVNACTKDTETKDGMGLTGHHGCGNKHVARNALYLG